MILYQGRVSVPGIEAIHLAYIPADDDGPNWDLEGVFGSADHQASLEIVKVAVFLNRLHWHGA